MGGGTGTLQGGVEQQAADGAGQQLPDPDGQHIDRQHLGRENRGHQSQLQAHHHGVDHHRRQGREHRDAFYPEVPQPPGQQRGGQGGQGAEQQIPRAGGIGPHAQAHQVGNQAAHGQAGDGRRGEDGQNGQHFGNAALSNAEGRGGQQQGQRRVHGGDQPRLRQGAHRGLGFHDTTYFP